MTASHHRQNAHLTFKENVDAGRHGWLRLTPAYSYKLVVDVLSGVPKSACILDPFAGSGTTGLIAAERNYNAVLVDLNPFLVWFSEVKTRNYSAATLDEAAVQGEAIADRACKLRHESLWQPKVHDIVRWWSPGVLQGLKALRAVLDETPQNHARDLLLVAFCRTLMASSSAAFDHQSMSFRDRTGHAASDWAADLGSTLAMFLNEVRHIVSTARTPLPGSVYVVHADARCLAGALPGPADLLCTSPPYANRMSYIRELRPYMFWLRYLETPRDAGDLDWQMIGGTWGVATSRVGGWTPQHEIPLKSQLASTAKRIVASNGRHADLLARYVGKYFEDMWLHIRSIPRLLAPGGRAVYIVGNSTFYGTMVPTQDWFAEMLYHTGLADITIDPIRKRNSKKELYEYAVMGRVP